MTDGELHRIDWNHPVLGRIEETACPAHEQDVLRALTTLGIGCGGTTEYEGRACDRCVNAGFRPRVWMDARAVK